MTLSLLGIFELAGIYSLVALGVYLSFRVVNFPDLTVDGSFTLGAAVTSACIITGLPPIVATLLAVLAGMIAGWITASLHVHLRMMGLLASILVMSALYSINMRIMGQPNLALLNFATIFSGVSSLLLLGFLVMAIYLFLTRLMASQFGLSIRAMGMNPNFSRSYGVNTNKIILFTLALSNGLVALGGALFAQLEGFADVSLGTGTIIIGLASVLIGEALIRSTRPLLSFLACIVGAIIYRFIIAIALNTPELGLQPADLNFLTTVLVVVAVGIPYFYQERKNART